MLIHIVVNEKPMPKSVAMALCGTNFLCGEVVEARWDDGRMCAECIAGQDSDLYRKTQKVYAVIEETTEHDVRLDYVGINPRPRLTCYILECVGATLVRQPYMNADVWKQKEAEFLLQHPCANIQDDGYRG